MVLEYVHPQSDTQKLLKSLVSSLLIMIAREYHRQNAANPTSLAVQMVNYIDQDPGNMTLQKLGQHFGYHPNYVSALLHCQTWKTFTQLQLEQRMARAKMLLKGTDLTVEEIATILGYSDSSNFYKAFKRFYGVSPRKQA